MTDAGRKRLLLALLAVLVAVFGWRALGGPRATPGGAGPGVRSSAAETRVLQVEILRLADLELEPGEFELGRDPFRFAPREPPPPPSPPPPPPRKTPPPAPRAEPQPAGPQPPPVDVLYLGRFGPVAAPIAVFSDGKEIYNVRQGDVLKENFRVDKIGYESADLSFVGFPDTPVQRLAVGGKS